MDKDLEQFLIVIQVLLQIRHALFESPMVFLFLDFEKVIVVAALFAIVFDHHVHRFDGAR